MHRTAVLTLLVLSCSDGTEHAELLGHVVGALAYEQDHYGGHYTVDGITLEIPWTLVLKAHEKVPRNVRVEVLHGQTREILDIFDAQQRPDATSFSVTLPHSYELVPITLALHTRFEEIPLRALDDSTPLAIEPAELFEFSLPPGFHRRLEFRQTPPVPIQMYEVKPEELEKQHGTPSHDEGNTP